MVELLIQIDSNEAIIEDFINSYSLTIYNIPLIISILNTIIATITACIVAYVAWKQHKLEKEKLKLDLFEKRYEVYKAIKEHLSFFYLNSNSEYKLIIEKFNEFKSNTQEVAFIFNNEIYNFTKLIVERTLELHKINLELENEPPEHKSEKIKNKMELIEYFKESLDDLNEVFSPYLKFDKWND